MVGVVGLEDGAKVVGCKVVGMVGETEGSEVVGCNEGPLVHSSDETIALRQTKYHIRGLVGPVCLCPSMSVASGSPH